jgi:two-component system response regulator NreC
MAERIQDAEIPDLNGNPIRILLADDHDILRSGLRSLIERQANFEIVAEARDGREAVELCLKLVPDIVLMDISMPVLNGIEATSQIREKSQKVKVIILSVHSSRRFVGEVFRAGANGYLIKNCNFKEVVYAVGAVTAGGTYICPQVANVLRDDYLQFLEDKYDSIAATLTKREKEVLQLIAEGKNMKEIAFGFNLSVKTIEAHRQNIMEKLDLHNVAALTKYAIREGLTTEEY